MIRFAITISIVALLVACGSSDDTRTADDSSMPSAAMPEAVADDAVEEATADLAVDAAVEEAAVDVTAGADATMDPQAATCMDLVSQMKFQEAVPACLAAADADPANQQVQDALSQAQAETAKLTATGAAASAEADADAATGDAAAKLGGATGGIKLGN